MDSLIASAARALATGDPLGALERVALRDDPSALALRGIAMAQLGDYQRARQLLHRAGRGFGPTERLARARCRLAEAEVALAMRDLTWSCGTLEAAARELSELGDDINALHTRLIVARRQLLMGDLDAAERALGSVHAESKTAFAPLQARAELTRAELAARRVRASEAAPALDRAQALAEAAGIPALVAEVLRAREALSAPSAHLIRAGVTFPIRLAEVEALLASGELVVDACRRAVRGRAGTVGLASRPVLFNLACALAQAWPEDVARERLIEQAFRARAPDASHRARLRVELARLRSALGPLARIIATRRGYRLTPKEAEAVAVLAPPVEGPAGSVLALLAGGEAWSTSALADALGCSQRAVQRALRELEETSAVQAVGRGRSRRWLAPALGGFATTLLLPGALPV